MKFYVGEVVCYRRNDRNLAEAKVVARHRWSRQYTVQDHWWWDLVTGERDDFDGDMKGFTARVDEASLIEGATLWAVLCMMEWRAGRVLIDGEWRLPSPLVKELNEHIDY